MKARQKRILRIQRLRALEESKLNSLAVELAAIESRLTKQTGQLVRLKSQIDETSTSASDHSVDKHAQTMIWITHLQSHANNLKREISETVLQRNETLNRAMEQKSKVRGWESLADRLSAEANSELEKLESLVADDRYLNDRSPR